jgi:hypothetical protein
MQHLEVSSAVRPIYMSLGGRGLSNIREVLYHVHELQKITVSAYIHTSHHKHLVTVTAV